MLPGWSDVSATDGTEDVPRERFGALCTAVLQLYFHVYSRPTPDSCCRRARVSSFTQKNPWGLAILRSVRPMAPSLLLYTWYVFLFGNAIGGKYFAIFDGMRGD